MSSAAGTFAYRSGQSDGALMFGVLALTADQILKLIV